jgi:hexosaminidase
MRPFSPGDMVPLVQAAEDLGRRGIKASISEVATKNTSLIVFHDPRITSSEAYRLEISKERITITASADAGAYYAVQTLRDMLKYCGRKLPCCVIEDGPDFPRRGIYHDCSRGKVPKLSTLMALVERLAHWKVNELQLYIENVFTFREHPSIGKGYSPFTRAEISALQEHCRRHHVRLVGSLASLGHMEKILALPRYRKLGELAGYRGWPGGTTMCPTDPRSIKLVGELYDEFIPLFAAEDFNVCGDEPWELGEGRSKRAAKRIGKGRVYLDYILRLYELCQKHGKRMNMWADIVLEHPELLPELPKDIVLLNWDYNVGGPRVKRTREIARAGSPFMVCPGTSSWNTHGTRLGNAIGNVAEFAEAGLKYGAEGLLNTDWGDNGHRNMLGVSLHGFAHGAAHSWNHRGVNDRTFTELFCIRVFGRIGKSLVRPLRTLGSTYLACGAPYRNESGLFYALDEPLTESGEKSRIDIMKPEGLGRVLKELASPEIWPSGADDLGEFESIALREFRLAAAMDFVAAARAMVGRNMQAGKGAPATILRQIADEMHAITGEFKELWLLRNKQSRLSENVAIFRKAETEALKLARHG